VANVIGVSVGATGRAVVTGLVVARAPMMVSAPDAPPNAIAGGLVALTATVWPPGDGVTVRRRIAIAINPNVPVVSANAFDDAAGVSDSRS